MFQWPFNSTGFPPLEEGPDWQYRVTGPSVEDVQIDLLQELYMEADEICGNEDLRVGIEAVKRLIRRKIQEIKEAD